MLTRNVTALIWSAISGKAHVGYATNAVGLTSGHYSLVGFTGAMTNGSVTKIESVVTTKSGTMVAFGSGTTPPTVDDYTLESQITEGISVTNPSAAQVNTTDDFFELTTTYGISASRDTTIAEIGLFVFTNGTTYMYDRTVLETPIVIPAGQSKQVTYTIRLNKPK